MTAVVERPHARDVTALYESHFTHGYNVRAAGWERTLARRAQAQLRARLLRLPTRPLRVLDVGCGTGRNLSLLRSLGLKIESYRGIDQSLRMLSKIDTTAMPRHYSLDVVDLDTTTPFACDDAVGTYDLVLCTWVLSHLRHADELLDSMLATTAPGGRTLIAALTQTPRPVGALIGQRYRHIHAWPIDDQIVRNRQPQFFETGLYGLTTVAEWVGDAFTFSHDSNIVS